MTPEAIIALVCLLVALPPTAFVVWKWWQRCQKIRDVESAYEVELSETLLAREGPRRAPTFSIATGCLVTRMDIGFGDGQQLPLTWNDLSHGQSHTPERITIFNKLGVFTPQ